MQLELLAIKEKNSCPLCIRSPKTTWYYEDDEWWVVEDINNHGYELTILVVLKEHKHLNEWTKEERNKAKGFVELQLID